VSRTGSGHGVTRLVGAAGMTADVVAAGVARAQARLLAEIESAANREASTMRLFSISISDRLTALIKKRTQ
jgi:hypothetical protein